MRKNAWSLKWQLKKHTTTYIYRFEVEYDSNAPLRPFPELSSHTLYKTGYKIQPSPKRRETVTPYFLSD
jgi:hypothetical protein